MQAVTRVIPLSGIFKKKLFTNLSIFLNTERK